MYLPVVCIQITFFCSSLKNMQTCYMYIKDKIQYTFLKKNSVILDIAMMNVAFIRFSSILPLCGLHFLHSGYSY